MSWHYRESVRPSRRRGLSLLAALRSLILVHELLNLVLKIFHVERVTCTASWKNGQCRTAAEALLLRAGVLTLRQGAMEEAADELKAFASNGIVTGPARGFWVAVLCSAGAEVPGMPPLQGSDSEPRQTTLEDLNALPRAVQGAPAV